MEKIIRIKSEEADAIQRAITRSRNTEDHVQEEIIASFHAHFENGVSAQIDVVDGNGPVVRSRLFSKEGVLVVNQNEKLQELPKSYSFEYGFIYKVTLDEA